jgi:hypothetical protein
VVLTFDALPNRRFQGQVAAIAPSGTTTQGVVGYLVSVNLSNAQGVLPGMTAAAQITTAERSDVLMVPNRALSRATGQAAQGQGQAARNLQVLTDRGVETRTVRIGMANDQNTEIVSGLDEGDQVVLPTTTARASVPGASSAGASNPFGGGSAPQVRF